MVLVKLGYDTSKKYKWRLLPFDYSKELYNKKLVVVINEMLWGKVKMIMDERDNGFDALLLIDGKRRSGKSTLGKSVAYLLQPSLTINNYVVGIDEAPEKIDKANVEDVLIFDEGSLVASSKDGMAKKNKQLEKIIDVVGVKRLTLIFCMPEFFRISQSIAITHSLFLLHVYLDKRRRRGNFAYFGTRKKKILYEIGKKNHGSYSKPRCNFKGLFKDFKLPFEEEYDKIKAESLKEAINPDHNNKIEKPKTETELKTKLLGEFRDKNPDVTIKNLAKGFGISETEIYRRLKAYRSSKD